MMDPSILRDSSHHNVNLPSPHDPHIHPNGDGYSYDINIGTPDAHLARAYAGHHNPLGLGLPQNSPLYHNQIGGLASPGLSFNDFDEMKVS